MVGFLCGLNERIGGKIGVSDISWLDVGLTPSCFEGAGIGSGSIWAGICVGDGAIRIGAGAGEDMCVDIGAGELCFIGENEARGAGLGGKDECGLLKLYAAGTPLLGCGDAAGECFTGDPAGPDADAGLLKLCPYDNDGAGKFVACEKLPFEWNCGV